MLHLSLQNANKNKLKGAAVDEDELVDLDRVSGSPD